MARSKIEPMAHPDRIINYWKKEKFVVVCIIIFGLSFDSMTVLGPIQQGRLIDSLADGGSLAQVLPMTIKFIAIIGAIQFLRYFKRFYIRRFANKTSASMRLMIYNSIMHRSTAELDDESVGDLMTRAVSDVDLCVEGMRKFTTEVFDTGVLMASYLISLLIYDVRITLLSVLFIPIAMALAEKLKTVIFRYTVEYRQKSSDVTEMMVDAVENSMLYRITGTELQNRDKYSSELEDLQKKAVKANILENSMQPVYHAIAMIGIILAIYIGGMKVMDGSWTVGIFSAYITMFIAMAVKASKAAKLFNSVQKSQISWKRIKPYLSEYRKKETVAGPDITKESTTLQVKNLSFGYGAGLENIIEHINFTGHQGEIIGVTGSIASGKSTFGLSLLGLYPYAGNIIIDGKELRKYTEYERSRMISYMSHKLQLLSDTIYNNITLGGGQDITTVLQDVCFEEDLAAMPDGINTLVGNRGIRLSGGQQARIALARALLNRNKIIVLDDPFSAVDMRTEEKIMQNLRKHYGQSLIFIISHRVAIFSILDRILMLNDDGSVTCATHDELKESSGPYRTIFGLQSREERGRDEK